LTTPADEPEDMTRRMTRILAEQDSDDRALKAAGMRLINAVLKERSPLPADIADARRNLLEAVKKVAGHSGMQQPEKKGV
jgi:hypothetical protein